MLHAFVHSHYMLSFVSVLVVAATARIMVLLIFADTDPATANLWEYGQIARNYLEHGQLVRIAILSDGNEFVYPTAFMPPLMIWLWIGLFSALGDTSLALAAMLAINFLLGLGIVALTGLIGMQLSKNRLVAVLAMMILAVYPTFVFSVATYHAIQLYLFPFLLAIVIAFGITKPLPRHAVLLGLLGGIAALSRTEYVLLFGALFAATFVPWRHLRLFLLATVVSAVIVLPWTARNYIVLDAFIPIANSAGFNLHKGFNPLANGSGDWVDNHADLTRGDTIAHRFADVAFDEHYEKSRDDVFREIAFEYIRDKPGEAFGILAVKKILMFWIFDVYDPMAWQPLYQIAFWPIFVASVGGFIILLRRGYMRDTRFRIILALFATQTLIMALYAVHIRYRMNVEPVLFVFAAYFFVWLLGQIPDDNKRHV